MRRVITAAALSLALAGTSVWAASGQAPSVKDPKIGTRVTITGCLHQGTSKDSFVLLGVTERPADTPASAQVVPYAIYWLDSTDGLKPHVGEMVDVTGKVTGRRPKPGTITVSIDTDNALSKDVQVESSSSTLDVTTENFDGKTGLKKVDSRLEVSRPVYKLDVESVRAVSPPVPGPPCR